MIVSFAHTTPALLAGAKSVTRRTWAPEHAAKFHAGMLVDAWDRSPRTGKGRKVATIRITRAPWRQDTGATGDDDWIREGFSWLVLNVGDSARDFAQNIWREWHAKPYVVYVVEFELVEVMPHSSSPAALALRGRSDSGPSQPQRDRQHGT